MKKLIKALIVTASILTACNSNTIYFDPNSQAVIRCEGEFSNFYINSLDQIDHFHFKIKENHKGPKIFSFENIDVNFIVDTKGQSNLYDFKLRPNLEYFIINHSNGDAADGKLRIRTDHRGKVIYSSRINCK